MDRMKLKIVAFLLGSLICLSCSKDEEPVVVPETINTIDKVVNDMKQPHEEAPHGVPDHYDWAKGPRLSMGNDPGDWTAMITWGQVYEAASGSESVNTRIEIRNLQAWFLSKNDGKWHAWQKTVMVQGANYVEDFVDDLSKPADTRYEAGGTISITCGDGYNYHFWHPSGRTVIDPDDIAGVFTTVQARLILDDPDGVDDRDKAKFMMSVGGDYWKDIYAQWDQWKTNGDIGIGRFRFIKKEWDSFNMHSMTETAIRTNPPPLQ